MIDFPQRSTSFGTSTNLHNPNISRHTKGRQYVPSLTPSTLAALSKLPLLRSLTLIPSAPKHSSQDPLLRPLSLAASARDSSWSTTLPAILKILPPSIQRLDITRLVPWSQLHHLFQIDLPPSLRVLGIPRYSASSASRELGRTLLLVLCHERGITIEYINREPDLFCKSPDLSLHFVSFTLEH